MMIKNAILLPIAFVVVIGFAVAYPIAALLGLVDMWRKAWTVIIGDNPNNIDSLS